MPNKIKAMYDPKDRSIIPDEKIGTGNYSWHGDSPLVGITPAQA
jgi:hypothetical protein